MELSLIESLGSLGVGAVFGLVVFVIYRIDRKYTEKRINDVHKANAERLVHLLEQDQETREENTKVITELITLIRRINGRLK